MSNDLNIAGGRELDELLRTLPAKLAKNIMRSALRAGAVVYRDKVREKVPVRHGPLKKSVRISTKSKRGTATASVKVGNREAWYGTLVEYGTEPHKIKARPGHALHVGDAVVAEVEHPGAEAQPFMRPAADESHALAVAAVAARIRERLTLQGLNVPAPEDP